MWALFSRKSRSPARVPPDIALVGRYLIVARVPAACRGRGEASTRFRTRQQRGCDRHRLGPFSPLASASGYGCPNADRLRTRRMSIEHFAVAGAAFVGHRRTRRRLTRAAGDATGMFRRMLTRRMAVHGRRCRRRRDGYFDGLLLLSLRAGEVLVCDMPVGVATAMDRGCLRTGHYVPSEQGDACEGDRSRTRQPIPDSCHPRSPVDRAPSSRGTFVTTSSESRASA